MYRQIGFLVNVGDPKETTNDELREFINLDTPASDKQFILLVNKGKEGWNCRSLFGVALYRKPKSKIFVLQASMRCLRQIGEGQRTGHIYLSAENAQILDDELQQNFRVSVEEIHNVGIEKQNYQVRVNRPPVKVTLKRVQKMHQLLEKPPQNGLSLELDQVDTEKYRIKREEYEGSPRFTAVCHGRYDRIQGKARLQSVNAVCGDRSLSESVSSTNRGHPDEYTGGDGRYPSACKRVQ